ncbi:MAG: AMP-binding protein [Proteobacteria bacterium]|nr:AMP-binding protein [Pseudomonadota bacterium]
MIEQKGAPWFKFYDKNVSPTIEIGDSTYLDLLESGLSNDRNRPALFYMGKTITFGELDSYANRFSGFLLKNGLKQGDVVGIDLPNIPEYLIALIGAVRTGCAITGISPLLTPKEMAYQINDAEVSTLVILDMLFEERLLKIKDEIPGVRHVAVANVGSFLPAPKRFLGKLFKKIPFGNISPLKNKIVIPFSSVLTDYPAQTYSPETTPEDTLLIQYTGGTTGLPKGTLLTHRNIVANIKHCETWSGFEIGNDVLCSGFPFFHLAGLAFGMVALASSNPQCLIPDPRNTKHICQEIKKHRPTLMANVPTLYQMLLDNPMFKTLDFSPLKACISGAAPFSVESIRAFETLVGKGKVLEVYGMTEASPILTMNPYKGIKKIGSVGIPVQNTKIKIVDLETGKKELKSGEEGELIANGPQVMKGYHKKPGESDHALRKFQDDVWLYTGDVAKMDEDGYITIVDRAKDMLIVGGYKVFSREVEETLYQHPAIEFCAIVGLPNTDREGSEIVKAVIQRTSDTKRKDAETLKADILNFCRENMAPYKVPKIIDFVDAIPLTAVGKVDKKALR